MSTRPRTFEMKHSYSHKHITVFVVAFENSLDDRVWSFLGFDNRIDEGVLEVNEKHVN